MKFLSVLRKSLREQWRDPLSLSLTLILSPLFVFLYWLFFPSGSTTYGVMVLNQDQGLVEGQGVTAGEIAIAAMRGITYANGQPLLRVQRVTDRAAAETRLRDRDAAGLVILPPNLTTAVQALHQDGPPVTTTVTLVGDLTNPQYAIAAVLANAALESYIQEVTGQTRPIQIHEEPLGGSAARSEFEIYVPGLLIFAMVMLIFAASMTIAQEVEGGRLRRLQITRMSAFEFLGGTSAALLLVGVVAVLLTFLTAVALGFHSYGPLWVAILVSAVTGLSVIGAGLVVACFAHTVNQAFMLANFPLVLFMFFSGAIYPIPPVNLFNLGGRSIGLYDILPPAHAVVALNKVLTLGAGLGEVRYELGALLVLSLLYFAAGVWLFKRTHLREVA